MKTMSYSRTGHLMLAALSILAFTSGVASAQAPKAAPRSPQAVPKCAETVVAKVVALDQAFYVNRFGALQAGGMIFALERDVISLDGGRTLQPGAVMLRPDKRPRPLTLRVNKEQCLEIQFQNLLSPKPVSQQMAKASPPPPGTVGSIPIVSEPGGYQANRQVLVPAETQPSDENGDQHQPPTRYAGVHVAGLEWVNSSVDDGSFVGANDVADNDMGGNAKLGGLVPPGGRIKTTLFAAEEGAFLLTSGGATVGDRLGFGGQLSEGLFGSVIVEPQTAEYYRSQVTRADLDAANVQSKALPEGWRLGRSPACDRDRAWQLTRQDPRDPNRGTSCVTAVDKDGKPVDPIATNGFLQTIRKQPIINYDAAFPSGAKRAGAPVLSMLAGKRGDATRELVSSDLTAIITGPYAGPFGNPPPQIPNQTYPEAQQPYREFAIHYHDDFMATQAFKEFRSGDMQYTLQGGRDFFAINYGMGGIGASVLANRLKLGPAAKCATCKFEEFFLSSWPNGDPAMVVDQPVNVVQQPTPPKPGTVATKAFYPDDPSNVYHSYLRDHVRFRILHAGTNITHVHHQHAHQWLHSPKSGVSAYRDSQMISPGAAYTLEMVYGGSGNKNLTMGDSIFHCHFYPHFAQGMWALWRVHDVFERGTRLDDYGVAAPGPNRALPDGEIATGTPIPGLVPLPTLAMAPIPAGVEIISGPVPGTSITRNQVKVSDADLGAGLQPGYPFFVPGIAGQRAPHPPMSYAPDLDASGKQVEIAGEKQRLDGGLPRNVVVDELGTPYEHHNRWDFSKDADKLVAKQLEEEGTKVERAAMSVFSSRKHPSFTPAGVPADFVYNGQPSVQGAPFANPAVHYDGSPVKFCVPSDPNCNGTNFESRKLTYKSANIQTDVVLNKQGWHYPQQRMSMLWEDVKPTLDGKRRPEPLFMRVNSGDVVEFWLTNLIPTYYELDDFQVRTPTDVVGQHIHLVKFDVLASDGAGNGFNYESGTLAAEEVRALIGAINKGGGLLRPDGTNPRTLTAKSIPYFETQFGKNDPLILGAQATVELWYADPLTDVCLPGDQKEICPKQGLDRTMGTVFTHDHFGPSTHQQAGLYAGLVIEPRNSQWLTASATATTPALTPIGGTDPATGKPIVVRKDGGPTSWAAVINDDGKRHREFLLEFQDRQLAYKSKSIAQPKPYARYSPATVGLVNRTNPSGPWGWVDPDNSINAPPLGGQFLPDPQLVTNAFGVGAWSLNYRNEPLDIRLNPYNRQQASDTAFAFASIPRTNPLLNQQPPAGSLINAAAASHASAAPAPHAAAADHAAVAVPAAPVPLAAGDGAVSIVGDLVNGRPTWVVDGTPLANNGTVQLKKGQLVRFSVKMATHGILFQSQAAAEAVFDIAGSPQASKFKLNPNPGGLCSTPTTYGTTPQAPGGDNIIAELKVRADTTVTSLAFECSQHCANMAGTFAISGDAAPVSIVGDLVNGRPTWVVDGTPLANNGTVQLKKGQLVRFSVKMATHGILFQSQAAAEAVFDIAGSPQASKFKLNPNPGGLCSTATTYGTTPQAPGGDNIIAELKVRADTTVTSLPFECSQHCSAMAGTFAIGGDAAPVSIVGDVVDGRPTWVVDGTPLANNGTVQLKKGQLVRFSVKMATHGILFQSQAAAEAVFDIAGSPQASKFKLNPNPGGLCSTPTTYGTTPQAPGGDNIIAELKVRADTTVTSLAFECSQHCANMAGTFAISGDAAPVSIVGDLVNGRPTWVVDGTPLANNGSVQLKKGQLVRFSVKMATHGILFQSQAAAEAVFDIAGSPQASKFKLNPNPGGLCSTATTYGTTPQAPGGDNIIAELKVRADTTVTSLPFECSQHCSAMAGTFAIGGDAAPVSIVGDVVDGKVTWVVNGKQLINGTTVPLIPGQTVRFSVAQGGHGLLFPDEATANAIFDIANSPQKSKFKHNPSKLGGNGEPLPNTCNLPDSYGTDAQLFNKTDPSANLIAELKVKQPFNLAEPGQWMCAQHCQAMQGLFVPHDTSFVVADPENQQWLVDNEPLANNTPIVLEPGKKLRVSTNKPGETLFFRDTDAPAKLFEEGSAFSPMNLCSINGAGLALKPEGIDLTVKKSTTAFLASFMSGQSCQKMEGYFQPPVPVAPFTYPAPFEGAEGTDPYTPLMRAYPGETVEIRTLVGAHMASHSFNMHGVKWLFEQNSPNSGFRSTQGMGISEYYQMRFEVPTTNTGADYLYASTSDTKGLEYGQWGLLRAYPYNKQPTDLPPIGPAPKTADVCPADAPKRTYNVSVVTQTALPGGHLLYNDRASAAGRIIGLLPLIYVHDEDLDLGATPTKMKPGLGKRIEPLILRAAAGDCIDVTVTNRIPAAEGLPSRPGAGVFHDVSLYTSRHVSLHAQQVGMDVLASNGVTIGTNPAKTVWKNGDAVGLRWYAGTIGADGSYAPVELGAIGLTPADPLMQHPLGLLGALIVEPAGATWKTDQNSRAQATVTVSGKSFREFVLVLQDDVQLGLLKPFTDPKKGDTQVDGAPSDWTNAFNYRTEPLPFRYKDPGWEGPTFNVPVGIARALSNSLVDADPQTPVLAVSKGTPTRLRVVHPGGLSEQTFTLSGHPWQEEPFRNNSREIGDNGASQWFGGRDAFGANDQVNILLNSAGGRNKVTGDYLYRSFIGEEFTFGLWGVMRVGDPGRDIVVVARASDERTGGFTISGANTVNPDTGMMAKNVTITASVRLPDARDPKLITCKAEVNQVSGEWSSEKCTDTHQGKLDVSRTRPVVVASDERGRASVTAPIPAPIQGVPTSAAAVAQTIDALRAAGQKREQVQFRGARTPAIRIPGASTPPTDPIPSRSPRPDRGDGETPRH